MKKSAFKNFNTKYFCICICQWPACIHSGQRRALQCKRARIDQQAARFEVNSKLFRYIVSDFIPYNGRTSDSDFCITTIFCACCCSQACDRIFIAANLNFDTTIRGYFIYKAFYRMHQAIVCNRITVRLYSYFVESVAVCNSQSAKHTTYIIVFTICVGVQRIRKGVGTTARYSLATSNIIHCTLAGGKIITRH